MKATALKGAKILGLAVVWASAAFGGVACAQTQPRAGDVVRAGAGPEIPGPASRFIGTVTVRQIVDPKAPSRTAVGIVTFAPGARSNWHTHPAGQTLYVIDGCGWTQREGGPVERICKGDAVTVPAGVRHWHGGTATTGMTQMAITETVEGRNVDWLEPVADAQYVGPAAR